MHEFDIGSQDARFEIIVGHVVAIPRADNAIWTNHSETVLVIKTR